MSHVQAVSRETASQRILLYIGVLWLLLAAAIIISQLANPTPIRIDWETETEIDTAGFNVYRSEQPAGDFELLNDVLIPSSGDATSGSSYSFVDSNVAAGETYYYRLEDVELDNSREQHEIIEYTAPYVAWWVPVAAAVAILIGLFLIVKGLRNL
jgi:hypothetical protein